MKFHITDELNEIMFDADVPPSIVDYVAKKGLAKPFIAKLLPDGEPVYDGHFIRWDMFAEMMHQIY